MRRFLAPGPLLALAGVALLLVLLAYGIRSAAPDDSIEAALTAGERPPAPAIELERLDGSGRMALADWLGDVVVLNYWASWCEPCRTEAPALQRFHERIEDRDGTVVGVDVRDVGSDAEAFIDELGLDYPMLRDPDGSSQRLFGVEAYPETIVVDAEGRIAALRRGPVDRAWLEAEVEPLLEAKG